MMRLILVAALLASAIPFVARASMLEAIVRAEEANRKRVERCRADPSQAECRPSTGYELYAACKPPLDDVDEPRCSGRVHGHLLSLDRTLSDLSCLPPNVDIDLARRIFLAEADRTPEILGFAAVDGLGYALAKAFQCQPGASQWRQID